MSDPTREELVEQIKALGPWHHDIELFDGFGTGEVFSPTGKLPASENDGVTLISPHNRFKRRIDSLYPDGMAGKTFLDCACNAGAYCFWARERDAARSLGFDVREHWIDQANFLLKNRKGFPSDRLEFHVMDLYDVPKHDFGQFDMTYFSGIFYHLPDPITGLKIAADMTTDVLVLNTAMMIDKSNPRGLTMARESTEVVMSGVHQLAWFPNGRETLIDILKWLGFESMTVTLFQSNNEAKRSRIEIIAGREKGRLDGLEGEKII